jgi:hypothetical protein
MKTVYKYEVRAFLPAVRIPKGAIIRKVAGQGSGVFIWAEVDTDSECETRFFHAFCTGEEIPYDMGIDYAYLDTVFVDTGLVFHVYERFGL